MLIPKVILEFFGIEVDTEEVKKKITFGKKATAKDSSANETNVTYEKNDLSKLTVHKAKEVSIEQENNKNRFENKSLKSKPIRQINPSRDNSFQIDIEKVKGKGEDAPSLLLEFEDNSSVLSVADGMGGAGGTIYEIDYSKRSGAYLASRAVNSIAREYFLDFKESGYDITKSNSDVIAKDLKYHFDSGLSQILSKIDEKKGNIKLNIKSSLIKRLPTTFALCYTKSIGKKIEIYNFWAGDSRIYALDHQKGLHQLTRDDLVNPSDAYENLLNDSPISNCINADKHYQINFNNISIDSPVIAIAVSDGAYGYLQTPIHFEFLLIDTLMNSASIDSWHNNVERKLKEIQSDDISLSIKLTGYNSFTELKDFFRQRYILIRNELEYLNDLNNKVLMQENEIAAASKANRDTSLKIEELGSEISFANDKLNSFERNINSIEYDIRRYINQIEEKRREIIELEKSIERKKHETVEIKDEFEKVQGVVYYKKNKLNLLKETYEKAVGNKAKEFQYLKELRETAKKELWAKHKEQYENYLNRVNNEKRTGN